MNVENPEFRDAENKKMYLLHDTNIITHWIVGIQLYICTYSI